MGEIVFATPELGRWSTVGGLGVMVDELSIGLVDLGQEVTVISPYYYRNRKGKTEYLANDPAGIVFVDNISVQVEHQRVNLAVHEGVVRGVKVVFLHNSEVFPAPYADLGAGRVVFQLAVFNQACLEYCCRRNLQPSMFVTNDWFTGLAAGYRSNGNFGQHFKDTKFLHICHNLQETYEGRIHPQQHEGDLNRIHGLPREWFSDQGTMLNPSKCALMKSDQWATVSKSYRDELLQDSSLAYLLKQKSNPFAFPNGIPINDRIKRLDAVAPDHLSAKKKIQMKYFNFPDLDDSITLFAFVGRITAQKGVHLILDMAEGIIEKYQHKIQFLVGGPANMSEPYANQCAQKMWHLKNKHPRSFWAAPDEFFTDGALVNRGTDFGLMPSAFEPGGIVQHEFFVGATPVVAFKTGGLKDSVIEYNWDTEQGSGFSFDVFNHQEFSAACDRAITIFRNKAKYLKLRENAFRATMSGEVVCKAWLAEFCRLTEKNSIDQRAVDKCLNSITTPWSPDQYQPVSIIQEIFGQEKRYQLFSDIDHGANDHMDMDNEDVYGGSGAAGDDRAFLDDSKLLKLDDDGKRTGSSSQGAYEHSELATIMSAFDKVGNKQKKPQMFMLHNRGPKYQKVQICGSMDDWKVRHDMQFDPITNQWFLNMHLQIGQAYMYKYVINDQHWVVNDEEPSQKDQSGNLNNYCVT